MPYGWEDKHLFQVVSSYSERENTKRERERARLGCDTITFRICNLQLQEFELHFLRLVDKGHILFAIFDRKVQKCLLNLLYHCLTSAFRNASSQI